MAGDFVVLTNLSLKPGHCLEIKGFIPPDSKRFAINLGENASNLLLHFNPRFDFRGDVRKILCNSKEADVWGSEQRNDSFPFQQGSETTVCFEYQTDKIAVKLSSGEEFSFPVRMALPCISFVALKGIDFKSITAK
ncbi:galectin-1-like isoform 2-T2 [Anomaloglossus baeobatrachus]|uniref:galectin-1-like isoform X2 n=1 Tax=Anomaloglossus baeobatrachus TaxID=238106 RepID=UPI003F504AD4